MNRCLMKNGAKTEQCVLVAGHDGSHAYLSACEAVIPIIDLGDASKVKFDPSVSPDSNVEGVRDLMLQRSLFGLKKYGVTTDRNDLTPMDWVQHMQDELMDACVYAQKLKTALSWKLIETAPKDGKLILVRAFVEERLIYDPCVVWWRPGGSRWIRWPHEDEPTHWVEIPIWTP